MCQLTMYAEENCILMDLGVFRLQFLRGEQALESEEYLS